MKSCYTDLQYEQFLVDLSRFAKNATSGSRDRFVAQKEKR